MLRDEGGVEYPLELVEDLKNGGSGSELFAVLAVKVDGVLGDVNDAVLKVLDPEKVKTEVERAELLDRFAREVRVQRALAAKSDHFLRVLAAGSVDEKPAMLMERGNDETLHGRELSPVEAYHLLIELVSVLKVMHDQRIVHRDIKPQNIICPDIIVDERVGTLQQELRVKLLDLGLVFCCDEEHEGVHPYLLEGSGSYMSADLLNDPNSPLRDLYAAGVVIYELLYGKTPSGTLAEWQTLRPGTSGFALVPPRSRNRQPVLPALKEVLKRLLFPKRQGSFQNCDEVLKALQRISATDVVRFSRR